MVIVLGTSQQTFLTTATTEYFETYLRKNRSQTLYDAHEKT